MDKECRAGAGPERPRHASAFSSALFDTIVKIANIEKAVGLETSTADRMMADVEATNGAGGGCGGCR